MKGGTPPAWMREQERSHLGVLRFMVWLSLPLGRPFGRLVLRGIALYFVLFSPKARRHHEFPGRANLELGEASAPVLVRRVDARAAGRVSRRS